MILDTATPNFVSRVRSVGGKVFQSGISKLGGFFSRRSTKHFASELGMGDDIAGALACLGGEGRSLGQLRLETARRFPQRFEGALSHSARVSAGQPNSTPKVGVP